MAACLLPFSRWRALPAHFNGVAKTFWGFLLFKVIVSSAMAKWNSGDDAWTNLTALTYHYETQPLPTPLAYLFHQGPLWFHQFSCFVTFVAQMGAPFLLFLPRRFRHAGALVILVHQILIALTGNYNFFNLLTIALCCSQFDDDFFRRLLRRPVTLQATLSPKQLRWEIPGLTLAVVLSALSFGRMCQVVAPTLAPPTLLKAADDLRRFRSINTYGLFARMTRTRPEITLQGSRDGQTWQDYVFHHKPGPLDRWPSWVAPMQPRVDWQMWFAALGNRQRNPWLTQLMRRVLQNELSLQGVFALYPFPDAPPNFIRDLIQY